MIGTCAAYELTPILRLATTYDQGAGWRYTLAEGEESAAYLPPAQVRDCLELALHGNGGRYSHYPEEGWTLWQADPRVKAVPPFALNGHPAEWRHTSWLELDEQGKVGGVVVGWEEE